MATSSFVEQTWDLEYKHAVGSAAQAFFEGVERGELLGSTCSGCDRTLVPPRAFCDRCHQDIDDFVEVGKEGALDAFTVVYAELKNMPDPPYSIGYVRLDGADTACLGFIREVRLDSWENINDLLRVGMRMKVRFSLERASGALGYWFVPAESEADV